ncbi:MAG TPA: CDP-2,3-bis-(O-geranylgeranyl)-sn-glycerol synthase [Thermoplasmata archaeon]|jgi:CDP-2,3-bis-(O-geranylgeranyl)-sn-glycerol synthase|nr:MAG TPA: CDP-2,3-bis-(O-geranylgeranyl)-sn-glycerol synthase [Thermoplasmata archaeon]
MDYTIIVQAFWIVIPIYIANASAVIVGGGIPIDMGKTWKDGRRILGDGKTWRGLFAGTFLGMTAGFGLAVAASYLTVSDYSFLHLTNFEGFPWMIPILFSLCFGALLGDVIESFFKRRVGKDRGQDWIPFDQLDFLVGALLFSFLMSELLYVLHLTCGHWFFYSIKIWHILILLVVTPFIHIAANALFRAARKKHTKN